MIAKPSFEPAPRLAVINGLRGVAILAVLYDHLLSEFLTPFFQMRFFQVGPLLVAPTSLALNGWLGVNLFFLLSGFVLAFPYLRGQREFASARDVGRFYVHRAARLLPLYYLCLGVALLFVSHADFTQPKFVKDVLALSTFTYVFSRRLFGPMMYNAALWSIGVEFWFSVAFPLLLILWKCVGSVPVVVGSLVLCLVVRHFDAAHWTGDPVYLLMLKDGLFGRLDDFVAGVALCPFT